MLNAGQTALLASPSSLTGASQVAQWSEIRLPMQEMQVRSPGREDPLEKGMAAHSRTLAWEIPPAGEPGGLRAVHGVAMSQARRHASLTWLNESSRKYIPPPDVGFPAGSDSKVSACSEGDLGSVPGSGRSPGEGNGNPLQYSCLENPMDRGAWWATVPRVTESPT